MAKQKTDDNYPDYILTFAGNTAPTGKKKPKKVRGPHTILLNRTPSVSLRVRVSHRKAHGDVPNLVISINDNKKKAGAKKK